LTYVYYQHLVTSAIAMFAGNDAVLPFPLRASSDRTGIVRQVQAFIP